MAVSPTSRETRHRDVLHCAASPPDASPHAVKGEVTLWRAVFPCAARDRYRLGADQIAGRANCSRAGRCPVLHLAGPTRRRAGDQGHRQLVHGLSPRCDQPWTFGERGPRYEAEARGDSYPSAAFTGMPCARWPLASDATRASLLFSQRLAPAVVETASGGAIVNVSSRCADLAQGAFVAYGAGKAALNMVTRNMAIEFAPKVRVNAIGVGGDRHRLAQGGARRRGPGKGVPRQHPDGPGGHARGHRRMRAVPGLGGVVLGDRQGVRRGRRHRIGVDPGADAAAVSAWRRPGPRAGAT